LSGERENISSVKNVLKRRKMNTHEFTTEKVVCVGTNATMIWEKEKFIHSELENPLHTPAT